MLQQSDRSRWRVTGVVAWREPELVPFARMSSDNSDHGQGMKLRLLVIQLLIAAGASVSHDAAVMAQAPTAVPIWTGSIRCDIDIKGPGYINHQTHTWTLTGAVPPGGGVLDYPATWSVSGEGSLLPTTTNNASATWKTQGSAAGVRLGIFVRADRQVVVLARHGQLNVPNGTTGVRLGAPPATPVPIAAAVSEWRPFPTIVDAAASTHITGRSVTPATERLDALQPAGSQGRARRTGLKASNEAWRAVGLRLTLRAR